MIFQQIPPQEFEETYSTSSSSSTTDLMEDASSSTCYSSASSSSHGPLFELSDLMSHLPIKRGLSKYYEGRSESFTSLTSLKSMEELAKKENPYSKRMKICRNHGNSRRFCSPKSAISKKVSSRSSFLSTMVRRNDVFSNCNRPPISIQK